MGIASRWGRLAAILVFVGMASGGTTPRAAFATWHRASKSPIIAPQGNGWESAGTFNPSVVVHDGKFVMLYRAQDKNGTSRLGYAEGSDGVRFTRRAEPVLSPEED